MLLISIYFRKIHPYVAVLAIVLLVSLCMQENGHAFDRALYKEKGVIITASPIWKPFSYAGINGEPKGFMVDYWRLWSEKTGVPVHFMLVPWKDTIKAVADGRADMQSGLYINEERKKFLAFSTSYYTAYTVYVVRKGDAVGGWSSKKRWGVIAGTYEEGHLAETFPNAELVRVIGADKALEVLAASEVDAICINQTSLLLLGRQMGIIDQVESSEVIYVRKIHAGVRKGDLVLLEMINEGMKRIRADEKRQLVERWFIRQDDTSMWVMKGLLFSIIMVVLGAMGYFYLSRRKVTRSGEK